MLDKMFIKLMSERTNIEEFDTTLRISDEELTTIIRTASLSPSLFNLQPWGFLVVRTQENKEKLFDIAYKQRGVLTSSASIIVFADKSFPDNFEPIYDNLIKQGYMNEEIKALIKKNAFRKYSQGISPREDAIIGSSMVSMSLILAAESRGYETGIIGGFDKKKVQKEFDIPEDKEPLMIITIGSGMALGFHSERFDTNITTKFI